MKTIRYSFMGGTLLETQVPNNWPDDAVAEILAFRAGAKPGDIFEMIAEADGSYSVIATGGAV